MEYPIMFNNSNETASYSGSKGVGLCKGILIQDATDGGLSISAINSKGKQGCFIDIPAESVKAVANALLNAIGETTFQLGAPEPAFPESEMVDDPTGTRQHEETRRIGV